MTAGADCRSRNTSDWYSVQISISDATAEAKCNKDYYYWIINKWLLVSILKYIYKRVKIVTKKLIFPCELETNYPFFTFWQGFIIDNWGPKFIKSDQNARFLYYFRSGVTPMRLKVILDANYQGSNQILRKLSDFLGSQKKTQQCLSKNINPSKDASTSLSHMGFRLLMYLARDSSDSLDIHMFTPW